MYTDDVDGGNDNVDVHRMVVALWYWLMMIGLRWWHIDKSVDVIMMLRVDMSLISVLRDLLSWIHSSYSLAAVVFLHACEKRGEIQPNILFLVTLLPGLRSTCSWWHCFSRVNSIDHFLSSLSMMGWIPKEDVIIEKWVEWRSTRKLWAEEMDTSGEHV